jgi:acyl carrier protein
MTREEITSRLKRLVAEQLAVEEFELKPDARFVEDLGADSLDSIELAMAAEEEFDFEVKDDDAFAVRTFEEAVDYIVRRMEGTKEGKPASTLAEAASVLSERGVTSRSFVQRRVVCAALRHEDGRIVIGVRHLDPLMRQIIQVSGGINEWERAEQGFVDQFGVFMTREEALTVATEANQIIRRCGGDTLRLYSENLY